MCFSWISPLLPSVVQSESTFSPFGFPFLVSFFSRGPKRLTFYLQVLWASEYPLLVPLNKSYRGGSEASCCLSHLLSTVTFELQLRHITQALGSDCSPRGYIYIYICAYICIYIYIYLYIYIYTHILTPPAQAADVTGQLSYLRPLKIVPLPPFPSKIFAPLFLLRSFAPVPP